MAENVRRIAAITELTRELASINALRIKFFVYRQARVTPFRRSVGIARRERYVNMQDATSEYAAAEKKSTVYCG